MCSLEALNFGDFIFMMRDSVYQSLDIVLTGTGERQLVGQR